jgi:hypothetical protein
MDEKLEKMWKEMVVAYLKLLSHNLPGSSENIMETSLMVVGVPAELRTKNLSSISQKHDRLGQFAR